MIVIFLTKDNYMNINRYLAEITLIGAEDFNEFFNNALKEVFSSSYMNKIDTILKRIEIKPYSKASEKVVAYVNAGNNKNIFVNRYYFDDLPKEKKIEFLLHEFFHILQQTKSFIFFRRFKDLIELDERLEREIPRYLNAPMSEFLTGQKNRKISTRLEVLPYIIGTRTADWSCISKEGKKYIRDVLTSSGLFNINSNYFKNIF